MARFIKIFFFAAVIATTVGGVVVAYSTYHRPQQAALVAAKPGRLEPQKAADDDVLMPDHSWTRWPSLTDF